MNRFASILVLVALLLHRVAYAEAGQVEVASIEVRLFLAHSGKFSEPITEHDELWNTIIGENEATRPSTSAIVKVSMLGPRRGYDARAKVALAVTKTGKISRTTTFSKSLSVFNAEGKQYVAFWLADIGCQKLQLAARAGGSNKVVYQQIDFQCGE